MRSRTSNLNRRLHRLSQMQFDKLLGEEASEQAPFFYDFLVREMGSDVLLLESLEFRAMVPSPPPAPLDSTARRSSATEAPQVTSGSATEESVTIVLPVLPVLPGKEMEEPWEVKAELEVSILGEVQRKLILHRKGRKIDLEVLAITRKCGILNWRRGGVRDLPMGSLGRNPSTRQRFFFAGNGSTPWEEESRAAPQ